MHSQATHDNEQIPPAGATARRRTLWIGALALTVVLLTGSMVHAAPTPGNACRQQCNLVLLSCYVPFRIAFQAQKSGCTGAGKKLCIVAAKLMYSAGRQLCRSAATSCRKCCTRNAAVCHATCGDGILQPNEECDPPGWASCTEGAACGNDCLCPATAP